MEKLVNINIWLNFAYSIYVLNIFQIKTFLRQNMRWLFSSIADFFYLQFKKMNGLHPSLIGEKIQNFKH